MQFKDYVFLNRKGTPTKNSAYDSTLYKLAEKSRDRKNINAHSTTYFCNKNHRTGNAAESIANDFGTFDTCDYNGYLCAYNRR